MVVLLDFSSVRVLQVFILLQVIISELNFLGIKYQVLMLVESEQERYRWVGVFNEFYKFLRKNKFFNKVVSFFLLN